MGQYSDLFNEDAPQAPNPGMAVQLTTDAVPQQEVRYKDLATRYKVPVDVVRTFPKDYETKAKVDDIDTATAAAPHLRSWLADTNNTGLLDTPDIGTMAKISAGFEYLGRNTVSGFTDMGAAALKLIDEVNPFTLSERDAAALFKNDPEALKRMQASTAMVLSRTANRANEASNSFMADLSPEAKKAYGDLEYATTDPSKSALLSPVKVTGDAIRSLPTMGAMALSLYFTKGAASRAEASALAAGATPAVARAAAVEAAGRTMANVGAVSEGLVGYAQQALSAAADVKKITPADLEAHPQYQALLAKGYTPETARAQLEADTSQQAGVIAGFVDAVTNHFGGKYLGKLLEEGGPLLARMGKGFLNEAATEGVQSAGEQLGQNVATQANMKSDQDLSDGVLESAVQGLVVGGLTGGAFAGVGGHAQTANEQQQARDKALANVEQLGQMMALAAQTKLRDQSPQTFAELSQHLAEQTEGAPTEVRFDARTLGEVLNQDEIAKLPSLASQMQEALATGGEVSVPIGELLANVAGTPLEQKLSEHARVGDSELSAFEAKEAQAQAETYLQTEAQRVIGEAVDTVGHQASADAVKANLLDQFTKLGRFTPDVNGAYATIASNMYTALGSRLGMTPEEAYAAHPLTINGVNPAKAGETLAKGMRTGEVSVEGYHYSKAQRSHVSTDMFGTGLAGSSREEYKGAADKRLSKRAYFYVDKGTGINPEAGVGGYAHKAQLSNIYDADTDPLRLNKGGKLAFESAVLDAGFSGYLNRLDGTQSGQVVMLGPQPLVKVEPLGQMSNTKGAVVPGKGQRESLGRDQVIDALNANAALPSGSPTAARWQQLLAKQPDVLNALTESGVFDDEKKTFYKSELITAFERATEAPLYNQSATLRSGEETLAKYGLPKGGKYNTRDIAAALEARQREKWGKIEPTDRSPEAATKIANWMAEEVRFEMLHPRKSGVGWYSYKFQRALDKFSDAFPELKKDKDARATLTALIAITSDGQKVVPNFRMAVDLYGNFRKTGTFSTERGHQRMDSIQGNVDLLQKMHDEMGPKAMRKYLLQEATVSELRKQAKAAGVDFKTDYQAHIKLPMAAVTFGPKLGAFYANLMGASGYLTMDRWWSRTFNRYRGTLLQAPTADGLARIKELMGHPEWSDDQAISATVEPRKSYEAKNFKNGTELEKAANTVYKAAFENLEDAPFNATDRTFMLDAVAKAQEILDAEGRKISVADIQAVLWYYEKRLYGELGARQTADVSYEDAAKKVVEEHADVTGPAGPDAPGAGESASGNDGGTATGVSEEAVAPGLEPFDAGELNARQDQAGNGGGRYSSGGLAPLEGAPNVRGATGPDARLVNVAEQYARDNGIELKRQGEYAQVDEARAVRIAQAYAGMQHAPNDPQVKAAYADLIRQTKAQYDALLAAGYKFTFFDDETDPYGGNPWEAMRDLRANQSMAVYGTYAGFGVGADINIGLADPAGGTNLEPEAVLAAVRKAGADVVGSVIHTSASEPTLVIKVKTRLDEAAANALSEALGQEAIAQSFEDGTGKLYGPQAANWGDYNPDFFVTADGRRASETLNPLLGDTGLTWPDQNGTEHPVKANDLFRAVHDAFGHGLEGAGFRAQGEENAWQAHSRLFTGAALGAITSETRGQNSWLNYGAYGERNRTAAVEDTVFAEQKTGLMPEWTWTEGRVGDEEVLNQAPANKYQAKYLGARDVNALNPDERAQYDALATPGDVLNQTARGTFNPSSMTVSLLEGADLSTFHHEMAHFYLEVLANIASSPTAPEGIKGDMAVLLKWFGVKDMDAWNAMSLNEKRASHEKFAEHYEQYLFEGKSPNMEMQHLFQRFASWMKNVYQSLSQFMASHNSNLTPEVRGVYDRMLATEAQIDQAEGARSYAPLFKSAEQAGMTPEHWALYQLHGQDATEQAIEELQARSLRDMRWSSNAKAKAFKSISKDVEAKRKATMAEVKAEVEAQPVYAAWNDLKSKDGPKLETLALEELYGAGERKGADYDRYGLLDWKRLVEQKMTAKDGVHPDVVAEQYGFGSGDEMIRAMLDAEPQASAIDGITDQRLLERYGDLTTAAGIERAANEAVHNEARARFVATELNALAKANKPVGVMMTAAKQFAEGLVASRKVRDLKPGQHTSAESRAGKAAEKAMAKGDTQAAIIAKRDQLLQFYAGKMTSEAQTEVERKVKNLKKISESDSLPLEYKDQVDKLLERVDLKDRTLRALDKRTSLANWLKSQEDMGLDPPIPDYLREDSQLTSYKEMTVEEFRGLYDTIKQIEHLGRLKNKLLTAKDQRDFAAIRDDIAESIDTLAGDRTADTRTPTTKGGRWLQAVKNFGSAHIKAATWARVMDGGKDGGKVWEYFVRPANEKGEWETSRRATATQQLTDIMTPWLKKGDLSKKTFYPAVKRSLTRQEVFAMALNTGNASNLQRLLGGEGWSQAQLDTVLASMGKDDWAVAQQVWDHMGSYWPEIQAKHERVYGTRLEAIPHGSEVTQRNGLAGGYYPVKYDPAASVRAEEHADAEGAQRQLKGAYGAATTRRSFTKARVEEVVGRPLLYNLSGLYSGVNDVIHDLAWHEWLIDSNRLLKSTAIDTAVREHYGPAAIRQLKTWRDAIAEGDAGSQEALDSALGYLRQSVSVAGLGFNVMSAAMQPLGITQSVKRVGASWIGKAVMSYIGSPLKATHEAQEKSAFMANRSRTQFRDLNELRNRVQGEDGAMSHARKNAYFLMMQFQRAVDVPTWHGAYEKAISEGNDESRACDLADQAVIDSQGGGETKDLSAIERGGPAQKLFTTFYSFMNTVANLGYASARTDSVGGKAASVLLLAVMPAMLGALLKDALTPGDSGDDDWKKLARKLAGEQLSYLMGLMVVSREFGEAGKTITGTSDHPRDYAGPAGVRMIGDTYNFAKQVAQGEFDDSFRKAAVNLLGDVAGIPSAQVNRTITGAKALKDGKTNNPMAILMGYQEPR